MTHSMTTRLLEATASIFERLGFLFSDYELSEEQEAAPVRMVARVGFVGPLEGNLEVHLAGDVLSALAANMLGEEGMTNPAVIRDALGEVANVICGNVLPDVAGYQAVFDLAAPVVDTNTTGWPELGAPAAQGSLGLERGRVDVFLYTNQPTGTGV